ncbi:TetR/AcrR family transcriptional regulator [Nocardia beijingensis]|uniref:TetR/AcrR family transcriptional regulator n=1 Tax=Nocardia beijingensis TaxID=95162 RepID=A0ABW7WR98_9NOCA
MEAALAEYARVGWSGFTMDGVARAAGVGKSTLYLRWKNKEQLLLDSLDASASPLSAPINTGTLYGDVMALATALLEYFLDPAGWTTLRISIDAKAYAPALDTLNDRVTTPIGDAASTIFARGITRGELPDSVPLRSATECLYGSVLMHVMAMDPAVLRQGKIDPADQIRPLVHIVLTGIGAAPH